MLDPFNRLQDMGMMSNDDISSIFSHQLRKTLLFIGWGALVFIAPMGINKDNICLFANTLQVGDNFFVVQIINKKVLSIWYGNTVCSIRVGEEANLDALDGFNALCTCVFFIFIHPDI